ncbi:hypothetical protein PRUPE_1G464300 [Prunus persica]|uniref:Uncharacterized protein n=1 Tax=Prunus persica TaxID=3760 RepID=A0A251RDT9_PRUPE|nr:hypothetical protein PRUPE_1G464300 [Prunus persica]
MHNFFSRYRFFVSICQLMNKLTVFTTIVCIALHLSRSAIELIVWSNFRFTLCNMIWGSSWTHCPSLADVHLQNTATINLYMFLQYQKLTNLIYGCSRIMIKKRRHQNRGRADKFLLCGKDTELIWWCFP